MLSVYEKNIDLLKRLAEKTENTNFIDWTKDLSSNKYNQQKAELIVNKIADFLSEEKIPPTRAKESFKVKLENIPFQVREEIREDIAEVNRCFNNRCYRSAIILCGRVLEVGLHTVYYNITLSDLLEKSPGMGLGTLIAKLRDKQIEFDPGLSQQIHLINSVRVSSVHRKKEVFRPSREQTHAIILFTLDTLNKLFAKKQTNDLFEV